MSAISLNFFQKKQFIKNTMRLGLYKFYHTIKNPIL